MRCTSAHAGVLLIAALLAASGCGDSVEPTSSRSAPRASEFPPAADRKLEQILREGRPAGMVAAATSQVFRQGRNRYAFGVFTPAGEQITDADAAIYIASGADGKAVGPFPARVESLQTEPSFRSQTTSDDPDSGKAVYVTDVTFDRPGEWRVVALLRSRDKEVATRLPSVVVGKYPEIPKVGDPAPRVHTPTAEDVGGDLSEIDTRIPHDDMHDTDLANVLGKRPVVLLFATPALCRTRVCGPVVDEAEQVKQRYGDRVSFIHMEIYNQNQANKGVRPQVRAYHLPSEPWLFVIDRNGKISTVIEASFGLDELEAAVKKVAG